MLTGTSLINAGWGTGDMGKRFRVAFSFAGEKRPFVAEVAELLAARFGQELILYDKYHLAEFSIGNLAFKLPELYYEEADLVVAVICSNYNSVGKEWCGLEWSAIYGLLKRGNHKMVMLSRFDQVVPEGLYGLAGYTDLDDMTPDQFAGLILERLAINEAKSREFYQTNSAQENPIHPGMSKDNPSPVESWPDDPPALTWQMANHRQAQEAFSKLMSRSKAAQLLVIKGNTESGKTHLSNQFLANALKIPGLRCGRFDFKGAEDLGGELRAFADQLEVTCPTQETIANCLAQIFYSLKEKQKPTLLIFDTFEAAAEARTWMKKSLLPSLIRSPWLRVVLVGQPPLIHCHGEPWEGCSLPPIQLSQPTPEDWFTYGKAYKPDLDLTFVTQAHAYCNGQSSTLAQLLGPRR